MVFLFFLMTASSLAELSTISNVKPRLDNEGRFMDIHDGNLVKWNLSEGTRAFTAHPFFSKNWLLINYPYIHADLRSNMLLSGSPTIPCGVTDAAGASDAGGSLYYWYFNMIRVYVYLFLF